MSYLIKPTKTPMRRASGMGDGDWLSNLLASSGVSTGPSPEVACLNAANQAVAPLDARINNLAATWTTTGFYTPDQVNSIVQQGYQLGTASNDKVRAAPKSAAGAMDANAQAITTVQRKMGEGAKYAAAANDAKAKGILVVDAPGLRDWMIQMMRASSDSLVTASVLDCNTPWLAFVVLTLQPLFDSAVALLKKIVGVVVVVGQTAVHVAEDLQQIWTVVKWGGLAALGVAVAYKIKQMRDGR